MKLSTAIHNKLDNEWHKYSNTNPQYLPPAIYGTYASLKNGTFIDSEADVFRFHFNRNKANILLFDVSDENCLEDVLDAELHVYVNQPKDSYIGLDSVILRLYQILPQNVSNPDLHKLLHVVYLRSSFSGWQVSLVCILIIHRYYLIESFRFLR